MKITISKLNLHGNGEAIIDEKKYIIPKTLANEQVNIEIVKASKAYSVAKVKDIFVASTHRVNPICKHFHQCGGCNLQHLEENSYNEFKKYVAFRNLELAGYNSDIEFIEIGLYARRRVRIKVKKNESELKIGFYEEYTNKIFDIKECYTINNEILETIKLLKSHLEYFNEYLLQTGFDIQITLTDNGLDLMFYAPISPTLNELEILGAVLKNEQVIRILWHNGKEITPIAVKETPILIYGLISQKLPEEYFIQASKKCQEIISSFIATINATNILDLFAGIGAYTIPLSVSAKIHAVEKIPLMMQNLKATALEYNLPITTEIRDLEKQPIKDFSSYDLIISNPPRVGAKAQIQAIAEHNKTAELVLVYCDMSAMVSDLRILRASGYELIKAMAIDQFYLTNQLEMVLHLKR